MLGLPWIRWTVVAKRTGALALTVLTLNCTGSGDGASRQGQRIPALSHQTTAVDRGETAELGKKPEGAEKAEVAPIVQQYQKALPDMKVMHQGPATKFAQLSESGCRAMLKDSDIEAEKWTGAAPHVASPFRLLGPIRGVDFRVPPKKSVFGVVDCRMLLVLEQLSDTLDRHGVKEIRIENFFRPGAHLPSSKKRFSQHAHALAADIVSITLRDGRKFTVSDDFGGKMGEPLCGPEATLHEPLEASLIWRNLICDIASQGVFHHILTPNYNAAHQDHIHVDIRRDEKWFGVN